MVSSIPGSVVLFEPFHLSEVPEAKRAGFSWRTYLPQDDQWPEGKDYIRRLLEGRVLNDWIMREASLLAAIRAKFVVEGANGPVTYEADAILAKKGVVVVPDIYANAGGVTVSYYEWVQNLQVDTWEEDVVNRRLHERMVRAFGKIHSVAEGRKVPLRTAAFVVAIGRVAAAASRLGIS